MNAWYDNIFFQVSDFELGKGLKKRLNKFKNRIAFQNAFMRFFADAMARFSFEGLPETVSERVLKLSLISHGCVVFFEREGAIMALSGAPDGAINVYGDYGAAYVYGANGFNKSVSLYLHGSDETAFLARTDGIKRGTYKGVMVWENPVRYPFVNQVISFSEAVADTYRTIDAARMNLKNPFIVVAEESVVPTVTAFFEKRDENNSYIISSGVFPADKIQVLPISTNADTVKACTELVEWYENKFRELCGYKSNGQMDKKGENLISDEVHVNDIYEQMNVDRCIEEIQKGLDDANKIFGLKMKVVKNEYADDDISEDEGRDAGALPGDDNE